MAERLFGPAVLRYVDRAWQTDDQQQRIGLCKLAVQDDDVIAAHARNRTVIGGRYGTRFCSAFLVQVPVAPSRIVDVSPVAIDFDLPARPSAKAPTSYFVRRRALSSRSTSSCTRSTFDVFHEGLADMLLGSSIGDPHGDLLRGGGEVNGELPTVLRRVARPRPSRIAACRYGSAVASVSSHTTRNRFDQFMALASRRLAGSRFMSRARMS